MKNIKTQNIPVDFQTVSNKKTKSVEVSGQDFKKALQSVVGEEVKEEKESTVVTESESEELTKEEEEVVMTEVPFNLMGLMVTPENMEISVTFEVEETTQIDLPQPTELVMPEMVEEGTIALNQDVVLSEEIEQTTFVLPESEMVQAETLMDTETLEAPNHITSHISENITILENDLPKQVISLEAETVLPTDSIQLDEQPETVMTQSNSLVEEVISQMEVKTEPQLVNGLTVEMEVNKTSEVDLQPIEIEASEKIEIGETTESLEPVEQAEKVLNTDISASGQLTQMKLTAAQPELQMEQVKVVPQEQFVEEIQTMIVETVEGTDQVDRVTTTRIQLTPRHLGELDIEIIMKNNELTARLVVEKMETKQWLEQKLAQLTNTLAEQEIKVEQFDIQVSNHAAGFTESSLNDQPFFKQQKESVKRQKGTRVSHEEEQVVEQVERKVQSNTGRLSIWV